MEKFKKEVLFQNSQQSLSLDETKSLAAKRMYILHSLRLMSTERAVENVRNSGAVLRALINWDPSTAIKSSISYSMFVNVIMSLGSERHADYVERGLKGDVGSIILFFDHYLLLYCICRLLDVSV